MYPEYIQKNHKKVNEKYASKYLEDNSIILPNHHGGEDTALYAVSNDSTEPLKLKIIGQT